MTCGGGDPFQFLETCCTLQESYDADPTASPQIRTQDNGVDFLIKIEDSASLCPDFSVEGSATTDATTPGGNILLSAGAASARASTSGNVEILGGDCNQTDCLAGFIHVNTGEATNKDCIGGPIQIYTGAAYVISGSVSINSGPAVVDNAGVSGNVYVYTSEASANTGEVESWTGDSAFGVSGNLVWYTGDSATSASGGMSWDTGTAGDTSGSMVWTIGAASSDPGSFQFIGGNSYTSGFIIQNCTSLQVVTSTYNTSIGNSVFSGHTGGLAFSNSANVNMGISQESGVVLNFNVNTTHNGTVVGTRQGGGIKLDVTTTLPVVSLLWRDNRALLGAAAEKVILQTSSTTGDIGFGSGHTVGTNTYNAGVDIFPRATSGIVSAMIRAGATTPGDILEITASNGTTIYSRFTSVGNLQFSDGVNIIAGTSTGTKIGTATTQLIGFYNATPVAQIAGTVDVLAGLVTVGLRAASSNPPLNLGTGTLTAGAGNFTGVTISTATPTLTFTDSGGDDYKIDVASGNFGITNTTDGVRGLQCSATNEWLFTNLTFGGPTTSQLVSINDRISDAASISRAAFNATATVVTGSAWSGGNIRGFLGGSTYVADQDFNNGAALIGLEGGVTIISNTHIIQSAIGLFGTIQISGSSTTTTGTGLGTFVTVGAGHTLSTLRHLAVSNASFSGTVTTQYGIFMSALTGAGSNFEIWMDAAARTYYRASTQYVYSSAASTLDLDTNTTLNLRVGTTIKTALTATALSQTGDFKLTTAGNGLYIKEGTNACMGVVTLVAGTAVVATTKITANSRVFLTGQALGTIALPVARDVTARTAGTSFTITSANVTDTSVVAWEIKEPA